MNLSRCIIRTIGDQMLCSVFLAVCAWCLGVVCAGQGTDLAVWVKAMNVLCVMILLGVLVIKRWVLWGLTSLAQEIKTQFGVWRSRREPTIPPACDNHKPMCKLCPLDKAREANRDAPESEPSESDSEITDNGLSEDDEPTSERTDQPTEQ